MTRAGPRNSARSIPSFLSTTLFHMSTKLTIKLTREKEDTFLLCYEDKILRQQWFLKTALDF